MIKIEKAKRLIDKNYPLLGESLFKIPIEIVPTLPHLAATDGTVIKLSPRSIEKLSPEEIAGLIIHELLHIALEHPSLAAILLERFGGDPDTLNVALDAVINKLILEHLNENIRLPQGGIDPKRIAESLSLAEEDFYEERIYRALLEELRRRGKGEGEGKEGGKSNEKEETSSSQGSSGNEKQKEDYPKEGSDQGSSSTKDQQEHETESGNGSDGESQQMQEAEGKEGSQGSTPEKENSGTKQGEKGNSKKEGSQREAQTSEEGEISTAENPGTESQGGEGRKNGKEGAAQNLSNPSGEFNGMKSYDSVEAAKEENPQEELRRKLLAEEIRQALAETLKQKGVEAGILTDMELRRDKSFFIRKLRLYLPKARRRSPYLHEQTKKLIVIGKDPIIWHKQKFHIDKIAVVVDTSGSISEEEFNQFLKVVWGILRNSLAVHIYFNDVDFTDTVITQKERKKKVELPRGGGSDFRKVLEEVEEKIIIVLSDFYIDAPESPQDKKKYFLIYTEKAGIQSFFSNYPAWRKIPAWELKEILRR